MSLTGDPMTDLVAPIAVRFVGAVHDHDRVLIDELLSEVIIATEGRCDPAIALAVVCASIVPIEVLDQPFSQIFGMTRIRAEYERLREAGVDERNAHELSGLTAGRANAA